MAKPTNEQICAMRRLGMSEEEIEEVLACDKAIDRGERMEFDLPPELEKEAKKMANVGTRKVTKPAVKTKKENPTKSGIISSIAEFLGDKSEKVAILNPERQISFEIGGQVYELTLVAKRKPK